MIFDVVLKYKRLGGCRKMSLIILAYNYLLLLRRRGVVFFYMLCYQ